LGAVFHRWRLAQVNEFGHFTASSHFSFVLPERSGAASAVAMGKPATELVQQKYGLFPRDWFRHDNPDFCMWVSCGARSSSDDWPDLGMRLLFDLMSDGYAKKQVVSLLTTLR
jgi:hypothetical protein